MQKIFIIIMSLKTHFPLDQMATILADSIFKYIFVNEQFCIFIDISLKLVLKV